ncbi:hypothetical protein F5Y14DRAFT_283718 [Nemania sp. NC0429]|nr:hypothetical protein F5Y14DRAFT_283718 [Nemania sp. NC0429]
MFGLGHRNSHNMIDRLQGPRKLGTGNTEQTPPVTKPPDPPPKTRDKGPPDRWIYPTITPHDQNTPFPLTNTVRLVTSIIFALVVYFMIGFACISSATILGFPNPWHPPTPQATTSLQSTPLATSSSPMPARSPPETEIAVYDTPFPGAGSTQRSWDAAQEPMIAPHGNTKAPDQDRSYNLDSTLPFGGGQDLYTHNDDYDTRNEDYYLRNAFPHLYHPPDLC